MYYTIQQRVQMIKWFYGGHSATEVGRLLEDAFPGVPRLAPSTVTRLVAKFEATGSVANSRPSTHRTVVTQPYITLYITLNITL